MKRKYITLMVTAAIAFSQSGVFAKEYTPFADTNESYMNVLKSCEILEGFEDNTFRGDKTLTRAEAVKMLQGIMYYPQPDWDYSERESPFVDIAKNHWAFGAIVNCHTSRMINGFEDNTFRPDELVTEEQFVKMAVCRLGYEDISKIEGYPQGYVNRANMLGLCEEATDKPATREYAASILYKMLSAPLLEVVGYVLDNGVMVPEFKTKEQGATIALGLFQVKATFSKGDALTIVPTEIIAQDTERYNMGVYLPNLLTVGEAAEVQLGYENILDNFKEGDEVYMYLRCEEDEETDNATLTLLYCE